MALYAVVLTFPGDIFNKIDALRQNYLHYVNYRIEPHITLAYPFTLEADISLMNGKLKQVASRTGLFTLILDGIEYFEGENNVAYIALAEKQPVVDLHLDINQSINGLVKDEFRGRFNRGNFIPHVTIGEQIPGDIFPEVKQSLLGENIHYECEIASFSLFSSDEDGVWTRAEVFGFSG